MTVSSVMMAEKMFISKKKRKKKKKQQTLLFLGWWITRVPKCQKKKGNLVACIVTLIKQVTCFRFQFYSVLRNQQIFKKNMVKSVMHKILLISIYIIQNVFRNSFKCFYTYIYIYWWKDQICTDNIEENFSDISLLFPTPTSRHPGEMDEWHLHRDEWDGNDKKK